ncbi:MAG TPA: UDP-N-acetylmuramoyl-L-alanine--D-glutamate ligase [Armatimonadota bacterium]|nr:UDP-N-acetylmuramoyl-L-alanine--D-glutamate ligase [Armatimonadota bacterium]
MIDFLQKRIHVIGLGAKGTGRACAKVLGSRGALITISDEKTPVQLATEIAKLDDSSVRLQLGPAEAYRDIEQADMLVPSPGVPLAIEPIQRALAAGVPLVGEIELAYQLAQAPIVAITGTKGKTTTTTLIGLMAQATGKPTFVGGNIGRPLIELAVTADKENVLIAEVSSFQLEAVSQFHPRIAVFTNLYPDHLNRYDNSMELYFAAKLRLFARQTPDDIAIVNADRPESIQVEAATKARIIRVSTTQVIPGGVYLHDGQIISEVSGTPTKIVDVASIRLKGEHNLANVLEAVAAVAALGLPVEEVAADVLTDFRGVANRLEEVDSVNGVTFYNDSQGTTPIAVHMALQAFAATPPVLIAGGRAKISDFSELGRDIASSARALIVIGEAATDIATATRAAKSDFPIYFAESLPEAVRQGYQLAQPKGIVLMSPACASFDMFRNMEHRGDVFRQAVAELHE